MKQYNRLFAHDGVQVLVDGQFGSTGKGSLARWLAEKTVELAVGFDAAISSAGPNSGHTSYDQDGNKHVVKHMPTFAIAGGTFTVALSAGAIIDPDVLIDEAIRYPNLSIIVHPNAAIVTDEDKEMEKQGTIAAIAGTRSGTGAALMRKISRDPRAIWKSYGRESELPSNIYTAVPEYDLQYGCYFMEIAQGFSLGINGWFYPKVTSRECTVAQGIADAQISPYDVTRVYMSVRTFPIRVGDVDGFSAGGWYPDQTEISWDSLGIEPELTTVTKRPRRIATFSWRQFDEALKVNDPDVVFVNFLNYFEPKDRLEFIRKMYDFRKKHTKRFILLGGMGPYSDDIDFI